MSHESMQPPAEDEPLKFVFMEHTAANAMAIAEQAQDCDVIALEYHGFANQQQRSRFEEAATLYVSLDAPAEQQVWAEKYLEENTYPGSFKIELLNALRKTGKKIVTIDFDRDQPEYAKVEANDRATKDYEKKARRHAPNEKLKQAALQDIGAYAMANEARENTMVGQLQELTAKYAGTETKIAVLLGSGHTPVYHAIAREYPSNRVFVDSDSTGHRRPGELVRYDNQTAAIRQKRMLPDKPITDGMLNRIILDKTQRNIDTARDRFGPDTGRRELLSYHLSETEVATVVDELDVVKTGVKARLRSRDHKTEQLEQVLASAWDKVDQKNAEPNDQDDTK